MSFRFVVGDRVRVIGTDFATGSVGEITIVEYIPEDMNNDYDHAEYTVEFDEPIDNNNYHGNEDWELPTFKQGYFNDDELEFAERKKNTKRTSGFGKFIRSLEDRHDDETSI